MKNFFSFLFLLALGLPLFSQTISLQPFADGFSRLTDIANCGDDRLFVLERDGRIRIIEANGNVLTQPFLNINPSVNSSQSERGLLGLAFHPDYLNNGYFYVNYTDNGGDTQVSRFSVSDTDPNVADPDSEEKILDVSQPVWNHNGGCIKFGRDGFLYISLGDGGSGGDPTGNGQNRQTLLGKMLRIDVDNGDPYAIPDSNPFVNDDQTLDEIWAIGLRNAWRFSFDQLTGDMWIADVGQDDWEEVNFQPADSPGGENYGWRCYEGDHTHNTFNCDPINTMVFPVFEYPISFSQGCSVTGGFVYRGCEMPGLYGHYIFADYCSGKFWSIRPDTSGWVTTELVNLDNNNYSSFGENIAGELFVVGHGNGVVSKIISNSSPITAQAESCEGQSDGAITFNIPLDQMADLTWADGSIDTNRLDLAPNTYTIEMTTVNDCEFFIDVEIEVGLPYPDVPTIDLDMDGILNSDATGLSHQWYFNGNPIQGATSPTYNPNESGDYSVVVSNANGCETATGEIMVTVVSTKDELGLERIAITPNPFTDNLQLQLQSTQLLDFEITFANATGQVLFYDSPTINGFFEKNYEMQDLPAGIYFFTIKNEKGEWSGQVVKQ